MNKPLVLTSVAAAAVAAYALSPVTSGLKPGERVTPFHPTHVVGPLANSTGCFPCTFQNRPQVQVWVNGEKHENISAFAQTLSRAMVDHKGSDFKALIVVVEKEAKHKELAKMIKSTSAKLGVNNVGVALIDPSDDAVSNYKINLSSEVKNTVFVYKDWKVAKSFVNLKADKAGLADLNSAISSVAN